MENLGKCWETLENEWKTLENEWNWMENWEVLVLVELCSFNSVMNQGGGGDAHTNCGGGMLPARPRNCWTGVSTPSTSGDIFRAATA